MTLNNMAVHLNVASASMRRMCVCACGEPSDGAQATDQPELVTCRRCAAAIDVLLEAGLAEVPFEKDRGAHRAKVLDKAFPVFDGEPLARPNPRQRLVLAALKDQKFARVHWERRDGKTWLAAYALAMHAQQNPGAHVLYATPIGSAFRREVVHQIGEMVPPTPFGRISAARHVGNLNQTLYLANSSTIEVTQRWSTDMFAGYARAHLDAIAIDELPRDDLRNQAHIIANAQDAVRKRRGWVLVIAET